MRWRRGQAGLSLVEMLVALAVAGVVAAASLSMTLVARRLYTSDERRTTLNQQLRAGMDLVGVDLRQAGQGLPDDFPALEIAGGSGSAPDTLVIRRNLLDTVLPVCEAIVAGTAVDEIRAADSGASPPAGCTPLPDADTNGWPDNLDEWRDWRVAEGGEVDVYVFNPASGAGQFVTFDADGTTGDFLSVDSGLPWQIDCPVLEQCRAYVLEEHRYELAAGGTLRYSINGNAAEVVELIDGVVDFQVSARLVDGTVMDDFGSGDDWGLLEGVHVSLTGRVDTDWREIVRTVESRFLPRNVISL